MCTFLLTIEELRFISELPITFIHEWKHKLGEDSLFTSKYKLTILIYAEEYDTISDAIAREKQLKNGHKQWKWNLVKQTNPKLEDWYDTLRGW
ncbi:MAG: hypothetical protein JXR11_13920 [Balneola sp.]